MAKNTIADLSTTAGNNLDVLGQSTAGAAQANTADDIFRNTLALLARFYDDIGGQGTVAGTADAVTLTSASTYQSLAAGMLVCWKASGTNTGAATLNLDALGAKAIRRRGDSALAAGDIVSGGYYLALYDTAYNGGAGAWVLLNPESSISGLTDPNADRIVFWDDSAGAYAFLTVGTGLSITGTTIDNTVTGSKPVLLFTPAGYEPTSTNYATLGTRNQHPTLDFDTTTQESAVWTAVLPSTYAGGGLTVDVYFAAASATSGTIGWDVAIERIDASSLDIDADSFATAQTVTAATVPGTSGQVLKSSVAITSGANMDSLAAGEAFRIRLRRDVATDTATGDAQLLAMIVRET